MRGSSGQRKLFLDNCPTWLFSVPVVEYIERHGYLWPKKLNPTDLSIELACYAEPERYKTGKTTEQHFRAAWSILWPKFEWNEWADLIVWAWCKYRIISVIGHTSSGKSFCTAYCALADYLALPIKTVTDDVTGEVRTTGTATTFTTTKFDSLRTHIWGDFMGAIESSALRDAILRMFKPTTTSNELRFGLRDRDRVDMDKFQVQGIATDSADTTAGKLRGQHTDRRRIIGDECEDMGEAIYMAITNARVAPDFKAVLLTNPALKQSLFGSKWACPRNGWGSVNANDTWWETVQTDGVCLHFNGFQSPNIKARKTIHPYLLTQKYIEEIKAAHGEESIEWWMFILGFPAPDGLVGLVWSTPTLEKAKKTVEFDFAPTPFATLDPAFDYDDCVLHIGEYGKLRDGRPCAQGKRSVKILLQVGADRLEKEQQVANEVRRLCTEAGVKPEDFIMDATGNARGVFALLRTTWSQKVQAIYYGGEATDRPLRLNDPMKASEQVKYFVAELWFRASFLAREGMLCGLGNLNPKTTEDLAGRRYQLKQVGDRKLMVIESKTEYKKRLGRSPDYGDPFCQIGELMVRRGMLASIEQTANSTSWNNLRALAVKASSRYAEKSSWQD